MLGKPVIKQVHADLDTAPIDQRLRAMLRFLRKQALTPDALDDADVAALRSAGIDAAAARDALWVGFVFHVMPRLADTFGWAIPDENGFARGAKMLLSRGYKF